MRIVWFMMCFVLTVSLMQAQDGLIWTKKISQKKVLSMMANVEADRILCRTQDSVIIMELSTQKKITQYPLSSTLVPVAVLDSTGRFVIEVLHQNVNFAANLSFRIRDFEQDTIISSVVTDKDIDLNMMDNYIQYAVPQKGYPLICIYRKNYYNGPDVYKYGNKMIVKQKTVDSFQYKVYNGYHGRGSETGYAIAPIYFVDTTNIFFTTLYSSWSIKVNYDRGEYENDGQETFYASDFEREFFSLPDKSGFLSPDLQYFHTDNSLYDLKRNILIKKGILSPSSDISKFEYIRDNNHVFVLLKANDSNAFGVWNVVNQKFESVYKGQKQNLYFLCNKSNNVLTSDDDGNVSYWKLSPNFSKKDVIPHFVMSKDNVYINDTIRFTQLIFPRNPNQTFYWSFGDGNIVYGKDEYIHKFSQEGIYSVTLNVIAENGQKDTFSRTVTVRSKPPHLLWSISDTTLRKITSLSFSANNQTIAVTGSKSSLSLYSLSKRSSIGKITTYGFPIFTKFTDDKYCFYSTITKKKVVERQYDEDFSFLRPFTNTYQINIENKEIDTLLSYPVIFEKSLSEAYWGKSTGFFWENPRKESYYMSMSGDNSWFTMGFYGDYVGNENQLEDRWWYVRGNIMHYDQHTVISRDDRGTNTRLMRAPIRSLVISPDNEYVTLAIGVEYDFPSALLRPEPLNPPAVLISEKGTKNVVKTLNDNTSCVRYSVDGYHLWSTNGIWDIDSNRRVVTLQSGLKGQFEVLPDGDHVVAMSPPEKNALAGIYSMREQRWKAYYYGSSALGMTDVSAMAVSSDGKYCALGSSTGSVTLWSIPALSVKPFADFRSDVRSVRVGDSVIFENMSVPYNGDLSYEWDYGDGSKSEGRRGVHVYRDTGVFSVGLRISNSSGEDSEKRKLEYIEVESASGVESSKEFSVRIYPNPCDDVMTVECDGFYDVMVYDVQGNEVYKSIKNKLLCVVNTSLFPHGMYIVKVRTDAGLHFFPSVIAHQ